MATPSRPFDRVTANRKSSLVLGLFKKGPIAPPTRAHIVGWSFLFSALLCRLRQGKQSLPTTIIGRGLTVLLEALLKGFDQQIGLPLITRIGSYIWFGEVVGHASLWDCQRKDEYSVSPICACCSIQTGDPSLVISGVPGIGYPAIIHLSPIWWIGNESC